MKKIQDKQPGKRPKKGDLNTFKDHSQEDDIISSSQKPQRKTKNDKSSTNDDDHMGLPDNPGSTGRS